jgi:hypothetical protein
MASGKVTVFGLFSLCLYTSYYVRLYSEWNIDAAITYRSSGGNAGLCHGTWNGVQGPPVGLAPPSPSHSPRQHHDVDVARGAAVGNKKL